MSENKEKWAIIVNPEFLQNKSVCLMSSPFVKKEQPIWINLNSLDEVEKRDFELPFGIDATQNFVAHKVQDLHDDNTQQNNQKLES